MMNFEFYVPQHLFFGAGTFNMLGTMELPGEKALIVTTEERLFIDRAAELLRQNHTDYVVYDRIRPNPNSDQVNEAARLGVDTGCDFVLAIGGGSPMDAAQCIAMLMYEGPYDNDIWDYVQYYPGHKVPKGCLPMILVSTTAGTGSEVVPGGVISNDKLEVKLDVGSPCMFATYSIVDPELQLSIPRDLTACQGMDVIFHGIEGYLNQYHTPFSDMVHLESLRYAAPAITVAYNQPDNLEARSAMALASNLSGMGETLADVMSLHAMAHTLGSFHHDIPHGVALSIIAPETLEYYCTYPKATTGRMAYLARYLGAGDSPEDLARWMRDLLSQLDLYYVDYTQYGVNCNAAHEYAEHTVHAIAPYMDKDEHPLTVEEVEAIYRKAFKRHCDALRLDDPGCVINRFTA